MEPGRTAARQLAEPRRTFTASSESPAATSTSPARSFSRRFRGSLSTTNVRGPRTAGPRQSVGAGTSSIDFPSSYLRRRYEPVPTGSVIVSGEPRGTIWMGESLTRRAAKGRRVRISTVSGSSALTLSTSTR